jgi:hypothetical protein
MRQLGERSFGKTYQVNDGNSPKLLKVLINTSPLVRPCYFSDKPKFSAA